MKILVTGGVGYIGSITNRQLQKAGFETVVLDNLSEGHRKAVGETRLIEADLTDRKAIVEVFQKERFDGVLHFAAKALAPESMIKPYEYFYTNVLGGLNLLEGMRIGGCSFIVFSSTSAVYGHPNKLPVSEDKALRPVSVYGETKMMFESILSWYTKIYGMHYVSLRYFNAAGATEDGKMGEDHRPETHIIPLAIQTAMGKINKFKLYGGDYDTPDGTCLRDYIHVLDLADAHVLALKHLTRTKKSAIYNLGTEKPYSNKEVIAMVKKISGIDFPVEVIGKREGDPAAIYADSKKVRRELGWKPKYESLGSIIETAWKWHKSHPNGYKS